MTPENPPATQGEGAGALLPCPFCGGAADIVPDRLVPTSPDHVHIMCKACDVYAPEGDQNWSTRAEREAAWNRRAVTSEMKDFAVQAGVDLEEAKQERAELLELVRLVAEHRDGEGPLELNPEFIDRCVETYDRLSGEKS